MLACCLCTQSLHGLHFLLKHHLPSFLHYQPSWRNKLHFHSFILTSTHSLTLLQSDFLSHHSTELLKARHHGLFCSKIIHFSVLILFISHAVFTLRHLFLIFFHILPPTAPFTCRSTSFSSFQDLTVLFDRYHSRIYLTSSICCLHLVFKVLIYDMSAQLLGHPISFQRCNCFLYTKESPNHRPNLYIFINFNPKF